MLRFFSIFFFLFILACCQGTTTSSPTVTIQTDVGELQVTVEVADTVDERARGLMFRTALPENEGMLFLFPEETQGSFWMKNTPLSLDLIFIRDGRIVDLIESAVPNSETLLTPDASYTQVLEVPAGTVSNERVQNGNTVTLPLTE